MLLCIFVCRFFASPASNTLKNLRFKSGTEEPNHPCGHGIQLFACDLSKALASRRENDPEQGGEYRV